MSGQLDNFWAWPDLISVRFHNPFFRASSTDPTLAGLTPMGRPKAPPVGALGSKRSKKRPKWVTK